MAAEIQLPYTASGASLYAFVRDNNGFVYNGSAFEGYEPDHYANYVIALSESVTSSYYSAGFPTVAAGIYHVAIFLQSGGSPAEGDAPVANFTLEWTGTQQLQVAALIATVLALLPTSLTDGAMQASLTGIASNVSSDLTNTILDHTDGVETSITLRQALRLILAAVVGQLSGANTNSVSIAAANGSKTRIVASVDASGNRTSVSIDPT